MPGVYFQGKICKVRKSVLYPKIDLTRIRANALEEKELFLLANNVPFDDRANLKANLEDLRASLIGRVSILCRKRPPTGSFETAPCRHCRRYAPGWWSQRIQEAVERWIDVFQ